MLGEEGVGDGREGVECGRGLEVDDAAVTVAVLLETWKIMAPLREGQHGCVGD